MIALLDWVMLVFDKETKHNAGFWVIDEFAEEKNFIQRAKQNMFSQNIKQNKFYLLNLQLA